MFAFETRWAAACGSGEIRFEARGMPAVTVADPCITDGMLSVVDTDYLPDRAGPRLVPLEEQLISLNKLHHFVVLARAESYVHAAERLHLSQPALSRSIQALERECGVTLFDRSRAGVSLTAVGHQLLTRAEDLIFNSQSFEQAVASMAKGVSGSVNFGIGPHSASAFLPTLLPRLFTDYPKVQVKVVIGSVDTMAQNLFDGEIEFFLGRLDPNNSWDRVETELLNTAGPGFYVRPGHPLTSRKPVPVRSLRDYPRLSGTAWNETFAHTAGNEIIDCVRATVEMDNFELLVGIAADSDAVIISLEGNGAPGLVELPIEHPGHTWHRSDIALFSLHGRTLSPAATAVASILKATAHRQPGKADPA
ncbi:LysR family transcriptional regulator [Actinomadura sp. LOL_016]|uniref:LysR family transcriptional regulator n=1 Tax=unclassified Actinomadura TaxID=2626254 RepID=UPI003A80F064